MKVFFKFTQTLQTAHPGKQEEVSFEGLAAVTDTEDVRILMVHCQNIDLEIPQGYTEQNIATGEMGAFLGLCREAARKACQDALKAEISEDLKSNHKHNADFWPRATNTKYMNEQ